VWSDPSTSTTRIPRYKRAVMINSVSVSLYYYVRMKVKSSPCRLSREWSVAWDLWIKFNGQKIPVTAVMMRVEILHLVLHPSLPSRRYTSRPSVTVTPLAGHRKKFKFYTSLFKNNINVRSIFVVGGTRV